MKSGGGPLRSAGFPQTLRQLSERRNQDLTGLNKLQSALFPVAERWSAEKVKTRFEKSLSKRDRQHCKDVSRWT